MSTIEIKFSRIATEPEIDARRQETLAYLRHVSVEEPEEIQLDDEHIRYLKAVRDYPDMRAIDRDRFLGYKSVGYRQVMLRKRLGKGDELKNVVGLGFIRAEQVNPPGRGHGYTQLVITEKGLRFLEQIEIGPK